MRSSKQNSAYWLLICEKSAEFYTQHNEIFLNDMLLSLGARASEEYLECINRLSEIVRLQITKDTAHELFKRLFNNGESTRFIDSPDKKATVKMIEYEVRIRKHMAENGCDLPEAGEIPLLEFIE